MTGAYMLTAACGENGHRDVLVREAESIHQAIQLAEKATGGMVSHGHGTQWPLPADAKPPLFAPSIIIDASTGDVERLHDHSATVSTQLVTPHAKMHVPKGA